MFLKVKQVLNEIERLRISNVMGQLYHNDDLLDFVVYLNTQKQLFEKGINADSLSLSEVRGLGYSPYTKAVKAKKGQPTDRVTLKDTGEFYRSFDVKLLSTNDWQIVADTVKEAGVDLRSEWGNEIIGLTVESKTMLANKIRPLIKPIILKIIKRNL